MRRGIDDRGAMPRALNAIRLTLLLALIAAGCSTRAVAPSPTGSSALPPTEPAPEASPLPLPTNPPALQFGTPFPWSSLPVTGHLLFITYDTPAAAASIPVPYLALLDLATGEGRVIWRPPDSAWLSGVDLSPDRSELAISYAPPPPPGMLQSGRPGLYLLPADCLPAGCPNATPQPIVEPTDTDSYFEPVWSADGASLYLSHISTPAGATVPVFSVERVSGSGGPPELLIPNATWPRPSPDGSILAYVAFDVAQYINDLYFAAPDGSNAWPPVPPGFFISVDAPIFSPDGQTLYFSAAGSDPSSSFGSLWPDHRNWLERLTGVQPAYANGMPSEWWRLAVAGGTPERLTSIAASGLSGGFSPDGRFFAFVSYSGMGIMAADGSQFTGMFPVIAMGNVIWLP